MADRTIKECDRCGIEIKHPPWITLRVEWHHPRTLMFCGNCEKLFREWLDPTGRTSAFAGPDPLAAAPADPPREETPHG